jgi:glycosyltransferase involved in cell wall biosynthesis
MPCDPTFSVIIPCHNYGRFLATALDSVLDQKRADCEIVVIDDASTDNTANVLQPYQNVIRYFRCERNVGPGAAWATGLKLARGEIVCKLDADDWQLPGFLDGVEDVFRSDPSLGAVITSVYTYSEGCGYAVEMSIVEESAVLTGEEMRRRLLKEFFMKVPGVALRREAIGQQASPLGELYLGHDWEFFLRVLRGWRSYLLARPLAVYRIHDRSVTLQPGARERILQDLRNWLIISGDRLSEYYLDSHERATLSVAMAVTYLRIMGFQKDKALINADQLRQLHSASKLATAERGVLLVPFLLFALRKLAIAFSREVLGFPRRRAGSGKAVAIEKLLPGQAVPD